MSSPRNVGNDALLDLYRARKRRNMKRFGLAILAVVLTLLLVAMILSNMNPLLYVFGLFLSSKDRGTDLSNVTVVEVDPDTSTTMLSIAMLLLIATINSVALSMRSKSS